MSRTDLLGLFAYDAWANREAVASIRPAAAAAPKAVALLAHIAATKHLWLARIRSEPAPMPVWPDCSLDECTRAFARADAWWDAYLRALEPAELGREVSYTNTKGETFRNSVADIATHVVFHSHYHRGQVAALVRAAGHAPAYTDYIHAVRTKALASQEAARD